jgi:hypothetical protein
LEREARELRRANQPPRISGRFNSITFQSGVIVAIAMSAHAADVAMPLQKRLPVFAGELAAPDQNAPAPTAFARRGTPDAHHQCLPKMTRIPEVAASPLSCLSPCCFGGVGLRFPIMIPVSGTRHGPAGHIENVAANAGFSGVAHEEIC